MYFFHVAVASSKYHGKESLTYHHEQNLPIGTTVVVPLQRKLVPGIITHAVPKPVFITKAISRVLSQQPVPATSLQLLEWMREYYPAPFGMLVQQFIPSGLVQQARQQPTSPLSSTLKATLPPLTDEQAAVLQHIGKSKSRSFLLHGETGSGKTRVYLELTRQVLEQNRSAIVLTPEIGLTPQLVQAFTTQFPNQTIVTHSNLTTAERRDTWLEILESRQPLVIIGPRSALFSPLKDVGVIIMDESHETAYKQEQAPYYQTSRVASTLAGLQQAYFLMGSATPLVTDYYYAEQKGLPILRMAKLAKESTYEPPHTAVVDLREKDNFSRHAFLSNQLLSALEKTIASQEQALVFLNRRGSARLILCQNCGWQATCPQCDLPLTYHADQYLMRCHTCGYHATALHACPSCSSTEVIFKNIGTKAVVEALVSFFPKARIRRFDTDNKKQERLEVHFKDIQKGEVDILVGTQMLAKGLDLPKLSLVGIVIADTSLSFPDYTAEEKTYQLLTQIIGRVGRGHRSGRIVIQTYNPSNPTLKAVLTKDWQSFYQQQLEERRLFGFPPFYHLLKLSIARANARSAQTACDTLVQIIRDQRLQVEIMGPSPSFYEKQQGKYVWQLIVKAKQRRELLGVIQALPSSWTYDLDPNNLL